MNIREFVERQQVIRHKTLAALYALSVRGEDIDLNGFLRGLPDNLGHDAQECVFALRYLIDAGCVKRISVELHLTAQGIERFEREWQ